MNYGTVNVSFQGRAVWQYPASSAVNLSINQFTAFLSPLPSAVNYSWVGAEAHQTIAPTAVNFGFGGTVTPVTLGIYPVAIANEEVLGTPQLIFPSDYYVHGVVKDVFGSFVARTVRLYNPVTGALIDSTTSGASDGAFTFAGLPFYSSLFVMAFDPTENAVVADHVVPVR